MSYDCAYLVRSATYELEPGAPPQGLGRSEDQGLGLIEELQKPRVDTSAAEKRLH